MSATEKSTTLAATDDAAGLALDDILRKWPEVAEPAEGHDGLTKRATRRALDRDARVDVAVDVLGRPTFEADAEPKGNGSSPSDMSLDTLAALARESSPSRRGRASDRKLSEADDKSASSGVINFKAMIEQSAVADAAGGEALEQAVAASAPAPLATTQPSTPVAAAPARAPVLAPPPAKRSSMATWALAAVIGVATVVGYTMYGTRQSEPAGDSERSRLNEDESVASAALDKAPDPAAEPEHARADEPAVAAAAPAPAGSEPEATSIRHAGGTPTAHRGSAPERRAESETAPTAAPPAIPAPARVGAAAPSDAPAPAAATKRATADLDDLISGSLGSSAGPAPGQPVAASRAAAPPEGALPQPNRQQIQRAMGRVAGAVRGCAGGQAGMAMVRVTFVSDGSVSNVAMAGGPFAGTPAAGCMENAVRSARVPAFTNPNVSINYPFVIQPPDPAAGATP